MNLSLLTIFLVLFAHWISDFWFQTKNMAEKKSTNIYWLLTHCVVYGAGLFSILYLFNILSFIDVNSYFEIMIFAILNTILHFFVDFGTSRLTTKLYKRERFRMFFNVIGGDQLIHTMTLLISFYYINYFTL